MSRRDYYEVLEIGRSSTDQEIKSAYRKLALKHHPDRNPGDATAEELFKEAAEAYAVLAEPDKRQAYDRFGHAGVSGAASQGFDPSTFSGFEDIFGGLGDIFGFGDVFGGRRRGPQRGADLQYDLELSFEEAATGVETSIQIPRQETCGTCHGSRAAEGSQPEACPRCQGRGQLRFQQVFFTVARTCSQCQGAGTIIANPCPTCRGMGRVQQQRKITVKIPPGVATGQRLRIGGEGGEGGGPTGDLYVVMHVQDHPYFQRDGNDLYCEVSVGFPVLALGGPIQVPTLQESEELVIGPGTQTGEVFRLRSKGMPDVSGRGRGDILVTVRTTVPKKLTKAQRTLIARLADALPADDYQPTEVNEQHDRGLFDRVKDIFG